jgi:anti-sigma regulatory factor (Ser/Thr protein kinase)
VCAILNPTTGELVYSSAGHPPPVLVNADGAAQVLEDGHTIALGMRPHWPRPEARLTMPARSTLALYTDGLVERRRIPLEEGIARVADHIGRGGNSTLDELADQIMAGLAPVGGYQDDVVLLLHRYPAPLELHFPAHMDQLGPTRWALRDWLFHAGMSAEQSMDVLVAAGEAVSNAIEHGHRESPGGIISMEATALVDRVQLTIADSGSWKESDAIPLRHRGRGIKLMQGLMHDVAITKGTSGGSGTTVVLSANIPQG